MKGLVDHVDIPDSVLRAKVFIFHYNPLDVKVMNYHNPSLDPTGAQFADPLDGLNGNYYLSKGTVGHPHLPVFNTMGDVMALRLKPDLFQGFHRDRTNVNFFFTQTPYSRLAYGSSLKKDYQVMAAHSQNITPRWNVAFDYHLFSPEGLYASSAAINHLLDFTTNYYSSDARYQLQGGIIWQCFKIEENGGITADSIFTQNLQSNRAGVPVNLTNVMNISRELQLFVHQSFNTVRELPLFIPHTEVVMIDSVADSVVVVDTVWPAAPHTLNTGVIGFDLAVESDTLQHGSTQLWQHCDALLYWTNDAYMNYRFRNPLKLTVGLKPEHFKSAISSLYEINFNSISPLLKVEWEALKSLNVKLQAERRMASMQSMNASRLDASATLSFDSLSILQVQGTLQSAPPDLLYFYRTPDRGANLKPIGVSKVSLGFSREGLLNVEAMARNVANNVWINTARQTVQADGQAWLLQGKADIRLKLGPLHLDLQELVQYSTDQNQLRVPLVASKNSFYIDFVLFNRALKAQIGVDVRYHTPYYADAYEPLGGYFYRQDEVKVGGYLWGDVFVNLQIKHATLYIKAGHVNALWENMPNYFILPHYPGNDFGLLYGVVWHFFD